MINPDRPFLLYAVAAISYQGRANSELQPGRYVILHKNDGTLLIHSSRLTTTLNYQGPGAKLTVKDNLLISTRRNETITIDIRDVLHYYEFIDWSYHQIAITGTENDLRQQIIEDISQYFHDVVEVVTEYKTPLGDIDLLVLTKDGMRHIIEIKRKRATLTACSQIHRYREFFIKHEMACIGYIMSPTITENALSYLSGHGLKYIMVNFRDV